MRTEQFAGDCFTIFDAEGLDPVVSDAFGGITVVIQDQGGCGRLIVECCGKAWSTYFGAIGHGSLRDFLAGCSAEYVSTRMDPKGGSYLDGITAAVLAALRPNTGDKPPAESRSA